MNSDITDTKAREALDESIQMFQKTRRTREANGEWNDEEEATALREWWWRTKRNTQALLEANDNERN